MIDAITMMQNLEDLRVQAEQSCLDMAKNSGVRCWLNGVNVGDEKLTLTIYGKMTDEDRREIVEFAAKMDARTVAE